MSLVEKRHSLETRTNAGNIPAQTRDIQNWIAA
jgi:hypothetical protein